MAKYKKKILTGLKFLFSFVLVYFVISKMNVNQVLNLFSKANLVYLLFAVVFFILSKLIASYRLNLYFHNIDINLTKKSNLKLYSLGMFYNLFLPGGIGGDGYKAWLLNKNYGVKTKKIISILFADRLSGMLLIYCIGAILSLFIENELFELFRVLVFISIPIAIFSFWALNKYIFKSGFAVVWKSILHSAFVQFSQLISVIFILKSLAVEMHNIEYLLIFFISSIVSVLPISIGGIGLREVTFFYGAKYFLLNENVSIGISVLFFIIQAMVSLIGIYYHFKKLKLETTT